MEGPATIPVADRLDDLIRAHRELHAALAAELAKLAPAEFFAPQGDFWSPAQHLDHLVRSVRPLVRALRLPKLALRLLFGRARTSRRPAEVVQVYLGKLAAGAGAGGAYLPASAAEKSRERQQELLAHWLAAGEALGTALERWQDAQLDAYQLPHPLLGKLTLREMVAWSLYHGHHHRARIRERSQV